MVGCVFEHTFSSTPNKTTIQKKAVQILENLSVITVALGCPDGRDPQKTELIIHGRVLKSETSLINRA